MGHLAAIHPVAQVVRAEQGARRDDDGSDLDAGEKGLPQFDLVAQHDEDPVVAADPFVAQPGGELGGAGGQFGERQRRLAAVLLDDPQRPLPGLLRREDAVEPVDLPVERLQPRPPEIPVRERRCQAAPSA